jgi:hypothetical protein
MGPRARAAGTAGAVRRGHARNVPTGVAAAVIAGGGGGGTDHGITQLTGDGTAGPGDGSQVFTLAASGVAAGTYGDATHVVQFTVDAKGRVTGVNVIALIDAGITQLTGDVTAGPGNGSQAAAIANNAVTTAKVLDAAITLAKLANLANHTLIGRDSAGAGVPQAIGISTALDWIGATQGQIAFRDAAAWNILAPGTAGQFLQTNGAGANPAWASALTPTSPSALDSSSLYVMMTPGGTSGTIVIRGISSTTGWTLTGTLALVVQNGAFYIRRTTSAAANAAAVILVSGTANQFINWSLSFDITFRVVTDPSLAGLHYWIGFSASSPYVSNSDTAATRFVGFRFSTRGPDPGWVGVNFDGTTQSVTASVAAIAASTKYDLRIRSNGSQSFFSVNGGAEVGLATNFPTGSTQVAPFIGVASVAGAAVSLDFGRMFGFVGS